MIAVNRKSLVVLLTCQSTCKQEYFLTIVGMTWGGETEGRNRTNNILPVSAHIAMVTCSRESKAFCRDDAVLTLSLMVSS